MHLRYLHQDKGKNLSQLMQRYPEYLKTTILRRSKLPMTKTVKDHRHLNKGRQAKLDTRDSLKIVRSLDELRESVGNFSSVDVQHHSGASYSIASDRSTRRHLRRLKLKKIQNLEVKKSALL